MEIQITCCTENIGEIQKKLNFFSFVFTSDKALLEKEILTDNFKKVIGSFGVEIYKRSPYFYIKTEYKNAGTTLTKDDLKIISENGMMYHKIFTTFISFLWLIKDNCCSISYLHNFIEEAKKATLFSNNTTYYTSAGEKNEISNFSSDEIQQAFDFFIKGSKLFHDLNIKRFSPPEVRPDIIMKRSLEYSEYKDLNRIERGFHFLDLARKTIELPLKISFYVCIYESLFYAASGTEITHQISERVALYISKNLFFRKEIYRQVKEAYKIRSQYFHGKAFKKTFKDLITISVGLDNLTRMIFQKIILDDSDIFLQKEELLELSFQDMLFEDDRHPDGLTIEHTIKYLRFNQ